MISTGIYSLSQLEGENFKNMFGADKRISISLYDQITNLPNAEELAARILLLFTDERGAYKRTYANRFVEFDAKILQLMPEYFSPTAQLVVQDVGISDGRTAADFFTALSAAYPNLDYLASDYSCKAFVLESGTTKVTLGTHGKIIEIAWPPFVFNAVRPDRYYHAPLNRIIQFIVDKLLVRRIIKDYHSGKIKPHEIFLFAPKVSALAKQDARFKLDQHDILTRFVHKSDIIRAMNILNPTYFTKAEMHLALSNLYDGLKSNGLFILGSNQDSGSIVHGGVYQKTPDGFKPIWISGNGPPIKLDF